MLPNFDKNKKNNLEDEDIQFTISEKLFLEMLLLELRQTTIQFASKKKKEENKREKTLISEIQALENNDSLAQLTELIQDKKQELNHLRNYRLNGNFIRHREQYLKD